MEGSALKGLSTEATFFFFGFSSMSESASCLGAGGAGDAGVGTGTSADLPLSPVAAALLDRAVCLLAEGAADDAAGVFGVVVERGVRVAIQYLVRRGKGGKFREKVPREDLELKN